MKVALLGPEGTYTHEAALKYFGEFEPVFCSTISEVFDKEADAKLVPFENSLGGGVTDSMDKLREKECEITAEQRLEIDHCLLSKEDSIEKVHKVKSHPQALDQCGKFIEEHGFEAEEASSTAGAAADISEGDAAIGSRAAARVYDLNILEESIQDSKGNITRFFILGGEKTSQEKTSMILVPGEDRPGILHSMLGCFAGHEVNLSFIQSRPTREGLGKYFFFVEAEKGTDSEEMQKSLKCLETYSNVEILGSYSVKE